MNEGGNIRYYDENGDLQADAIVRIGKDLYGFDADGKKLPEGKYKRIEDGTGIRYEAADISEADYYVGLDGRIVTGWYRPDGSDSQYYFSVETGKKLTGVHKIGTERYFFEDTGAASQVRNGWANASEKKYYVTSKGSLQTGWLDLGEARYYFGMDGIRADGVVRAGTKLYFQTEDGIVRSSGGKSVSDNDGLITVVNEKGVIQTGWQTVNGDKYYIDKTSGLALTGYQQVKGVWYDFAMDGKLS